MHYSSFVKYNFLKLFMVNSMINYPFISIDLVAAILPTFTYFMSMYITYAPLTSLSLLIYQ